MQAGHAEEVARLKAEADQQQQKAVAALQEEAERCLSAKVAELAEMQDKLAAATDCTAELEERLEVSNVAVCTYHGSRQTCSGTMQVKHARCVAMGMMHSSAVQLD